MSVVLEKCPDCTDGWGPLVVDYTHPLGHRSPCWTCGGMKQVPVMLAPRDLHEFVAGDHGKQAA